VYDTWGQRGQNGGFFDYVDYTFETTIEQLNSLMKYLTNYEINKDLNISITNASGWT
jgi:hypothetical protein